MGIFKRLTHTRLAIALVTLIASVLGNSKSVYALSFTVTGTVQYQNPGSITFSNVQNARVEIVVNTTSFFGSTNGSGFFSIPVNTTAANPSVTPKVYTQDTNTIQSVKVKDTGNVVYFAPFAARNWNSSSNLDFGVLQVKQTDPAVTPFFIYDQIAVVARNKLNTGPSWTPTFTVDAVFPASTTGSQYDPVNKKISIVSGDGTVPSLIIHEYGHAVMHMLFTAFPVGNNCPTSHNFSDPSSGNCAWTEGWADFFQAYVRNIGNYDFGIGTPINLETIDRFGPTFEKAVAGALWDIFDAVDSTEWDGINLGIGTATTGIWGRMNQPLAANQPFDGPDFLGKWLQNYNANNNDVRSIFAWNGMCSRKVTNSGIGTTYQHSCSYGPLILKQY